MTLETHTPQQDPASPAGRTPDGQVPGTYGRVAAWLSKRVEVALTTVELTLPQYRVLAILAEGSSAASRLADRLAVRRPSITALVDGLVIKGLVDRRQEDSDRRRVVLRLTEAGSRTLALADQVVDAKLDSLAEHLPARHRSAALRSLSLWGRAMAASSEDRRRQDESPSGAAGG